MSTNFYVLDALAKTIHDDNVRKGWWDDYDFTVPRSKPNAYFIGTKFALIHSEVTEAMEAFRKDLKDDKLPNRPGVEVELADAVIRILDLAGALNLDLSGAVIDKLQYNAKREDHTREVRAQPGGKQF